jgi:SnoaL-like domain
VTQSPIEQLLAALDGLDVDRAAALLGPDVRMVLADGRRAVGAAEVRSLLSSFVGQIRATSHHITAQWHQDDTWIAEVQTSYELPDKARLQLPGAFVVRANTEGIFEMHAYGVYEQTLTEHQGAAEGLRVGGRWFPPL